MFRISLSKIILNGWPYYTGHRYGNYHFDTRIGAGYAQNTMQYLITGTAPGRMAWTNYIGHSVWGMLIFYGVGSGMGADRGLIDVPLIATGVYLAEVMSCLIGLHYFR